MQQEMDSSQHDATGNDQNGQRFDAKWEYAAATGMLLYYWSATSRPNIQYAVHQCAQFMRTPKMSHQQAILCICCYLKAMEDKRFELLPNQQTHLGLLHRCKLCWSLQCGKPHKTCVCKVLHQLCLVAWQLSIVLVIKAANGDCPQHDQS